MIRCRPTPLVAPISLLAVASWMLGTTAGARAQEINVTHTAWGDSITEGVGDSVPEGPLAGYPIRLEQLLGDVSVLNRGYSGEATDEALDRIQSVLQGVPSGPGNLFLLMEGTNDISRNIPIETTLFNLQVLAEAATDHGLGVVYSTLIPRRPNAHVDPENLTNQQMNQLIRDLAGRTNHLLLDPFEVFLRLPNLFENYYWDKPKDPVGHPNPNGYDVMASTFYDALTGIDSVPPVLGLIEPNNGDVDVSPTTAITADIWDFGEGIDADSVELRVDGFPVSATATGNAMHSTVRYEPPGVLSDRVRVELRVSDRAQPPNTFDDLIASFVVSGADLPDGDLNRNGLVDDNDLHLLEKVFGTFSGQAQYVPDYDINEDGIIDGFDLAILASNFGASL